MAGDFTGDAVLKFDSALMLAVRETGAELGAEAEAGDFTGDALL